MLNFKKVNKKLKKPCGKKCTKVKESLLMTAKWRKAALLYENKKEKTIRKRLWFQNLDQYVDNMFLFIF